MPVVKHLISHWKQILYPPLGMGVGVLIGQLMWNRLDIQEILFVAWLSLIFSTTYSYMNRKKSNQE